LAAVAGLYSATSTPPADADIFEAFADHVRQLSQLFAAETDPLTVSLLAAGRLLTGDLAAADVIIDNLPLRPSGSIMERACAW
jgi:hypothetical protein